LEPAISRHIRPPLTARAVTPQPPIPLSYSDRDRFQFILACHEATAPLDPPLPLQPLLRAEAGEFELLEREEHPGEAV
jgi:hypothetical protein